MLKASPELRLCADSHEEAVIFKDEYKIQELFDRDKDIRFVVDIGGNVGCFSIQVKNFFPNAKIILCEPEAENMKYARLNTEYEGMVYVEKAIIGDPNVKEVKFNICGWGGNHHVDGNFRWDSFAPMGSKKVGEVIMPAVTLAEVLKENGFPRIDLLKIDTEGMEGQILQSLKPWMKNVRYFVGEWHSDLDIPVIEDALKDTHNVVFDHTFTTHGDIFAELK